MSRQVSLDIRLGSATKYSFNPIAPTKVSVAVAEWRLVSEAPCLEFQWHVVVIAEKQLVSRL